MIFERNFCQENSTPYGFYMSRGFAEQTTCNQYNLGMTGGWKYARWGSVWENVENKIRKAFDPKDILDSLAVEGFIDYMVYAGIAL